MRAAYVIVLLLLLAGCTSDTRFSTDAKSSDGCYSDCGAFMSRHWCSSVDVNYTSIRITNSTTVNFLPLQQDVTVSHNCSCNARSCLW